MRPLYKDIENFDSRQVSINSRCYLCDGVIKVIRIL
jgi:hypothetical protein